MQGAGRGPAAATAAALLRVSPGRAGGVSPREWAGQGAAGLGRGRGSRADGPSGWAARAARELPPPAPGPSPLLPALGGERQSPAPSRAGGGYCLAGGPPRLGHLGVSVRPLGSACTGLGKQLSAPAPLSPCTPHPARSPSPCTSPHRSFAEPFPLYSPFPCTSAPYPPPALSSRTSPFPSSPATLLIPPLLLHPPLRVHHTPLLCQCRSPKHPHTHSAA